MEELGRSEGKDYQYPPSSYRVVTFLHCSIPYLLNGTYSECNGVREVCVRFTTKVGGFEIQYLFNEVF